MNALFFYLVWAHCLADYPLQGDFLARAKNQSAPIPGVPWPIALWAHAMIHAGFVAALTGSLWLGAGELYLHILIDYGKSAGWFTPEHFTSDQAPAANRRAFWIDQSLHVLCKAVWALNVALGVV